jgi:2-amino-4-hydroxy-6-hydroxymethyldihydropteridine diphosphokinase
MHYDEGSTRQCSPVPNLVYLSLGSNLGNREQNLRLAIDRLAPLGKVGAISSLYETEPMELTAQPWFLNCAVELETEMKPQELLEAVLNIEQELGRIRSAAMPKGPRIVDIDILLFSDRIVRRPDLTIPHPAMQERRFVLEPLSEIAPQALHPVLRKPVRELRDALPGGPVVRKVARSLTGC